MICVSYWITRSRVVNCPWMMQIPSGVLWMTSGIASWHGWSRILCDMRATQLYEIEKGKLKVADNQEASSSHTRLPGERLLRRHSRERRPVLPHRLTCRTCLIIGCQRAAAANLHLEVGASFEFVCPCSSVRASQEHYCWCAVHFAQLPCCFQSSCFQC